MIIVQLFTKFGLKQSRSTYLISRQLIRIKFLNGLKLAYLYIIKASYLKACKVNYIRPQRNLVSSPPPFLASPLPSRPPSTLSTRLPPFKPRQRRSSRPYWLGTLLALQISRKSLEIYKKYRYRTIIQLLLQALLYLLRDLGYNYYSSYLV